MKTNISPQFMGSAGYVRYPRWLLIYFSDFADNLSAIYFYEWLKIHHETVLLELK